MLEVRGVYSGYYRDIDILQGISLTAELGRITIVIGANGVGKSTLLKTIYGFLPPRRGTILYNSEDITNVDPSLMLDRRISYVTQQHSLFPYLTVEQNLLLGAWIFRKNKELIQQRMQENYNRYPMLAEKRKTQAWALSGGQQRTVEIARALMTDPEMLLMDEPSAGLEPRLTREIYRVLESLKCEEGRGIVLVDQNVRKAMEISDHAYVIEMGRTKTEGPRSAFDGDLKEMIKDWF